MMKRILTSIIIFVLVILAFVLVRYVQAQKHYSSIKQTASTLASLDKLTEKKRSSATECYPPKGSSTICKKISYLVSIDTCKQVISKLSPTTQQDDSCGTISASKEYNNELYEFTISKDQERYILGVTLVGTRQK
jgi:uncharacterized protein YpmB